MSNSDDGSGCFFLWAIYGFIGVPILGIVLSGKAAWYIYVIIIVAIIIAIIKYNKKEK